jgi:hypothetical protein
MTSREREDADRTYNDALTTLDAALQRLRDVPHPPPPYDKRQLMPLNERWGLLSVRPIGQGCRERLRSVIWLTVAPLFKRQHTFNAALVEHLNRNTSVHQEVTASAETTLAFIHEELVKANKLQARLIQYVQTIAPYVNTKDRENADLMRRINEDGGEFRTHLVGALGLENVVDELRKQSEPMTALERRYDAKIEETRTDFTVVNQATQTLKRELGRLRDASPPALTP